jgi:hypothetical protein
MLQGVPSLRVDFAQTMGALQSRQTASKGFRSAFSGMARAYEKRVTRYCVILHRLFATCCLAALSTRDDAPGDFGLLLRLRRVENGVVEPEPGVRGCKSAPARVGAVRGGSRHEVARRARLRAHADRQYAAIRFLRRCTGSRPAGRETRMRSRCTTHGADTLLACGVASRGDPAAVRTRGLGQGS